METDPQAAFGLFWNEATVIHERTHAGRALQVVENRHPEEQPASFLCSISFEGRHEGFLTLSPSGTTPRVHGVLVRGINDSFIVRLDSFDGGPIEFADFACRLLDYDYRFPPDSGVTPTDFVWKTPSS